MLPLFTILPFLRSDYDPQSLELQYVLKHCDSGPNLIILKKCLANVVEMMSGFPDLVKVDLYSCLLFIFTKVYEYDNALLISTVLPHLKQILSELRVFMTKKSTECTSEDNVNADVSGVDIITPFGNLVQKYYDVDVENINSVLTTMVLITAGEVRLSESNSSKLSNALIRMLESGSTSAPMAIQCIKSLIQLPFTPLAVKYLVRNLIELLANHSDVIDPKIAMEILMIFNSNHKDSSNSTQIYSVLIPLLIQADLKPDYVHEKLMVLLERDSASFKIVLQEVLTSHQRAKIEEMVKQPNKSNTEEGDEGDEDQPQIQLKTFGA